MESYETGGQVIPITGVIIATQGRWSTLFFVPQPGNEQPWASGEAGRYELEGSQLTLRHDLTFQGGGGRELFMNRASQVVEVCRLDIDPQQLAITFPSKNVVRAQRFGL